MRIPPLVSDHTRVSHALAHPTSPRSIGLCAIWYCINSSSSLLCPCPFFEATPPGAVPEPPVKTRARVCRFRGCKNRTTQVLKTFSDRKALSLLLLIFRTVPRKPFSREANASAFPESNCVLLSRSPEVEQLCVALSYSAQTLLVGCSPIPGFLLFPYGWPVQGSAQMAISVRIAGSLVGAMRTSAVPPLRGEGGEGGRASSLHPVPPQGGGCYRCEL